MARLVPDWGRTNARYILIGEAPGKYEDLQGKPFVGPSGQRLEEWWRSVGLSREDFYITNVYPFRPAGNDLKTVNKHDLEHSISELHIRLSQLQDPWILVPTGDTALRALSGRSGITKWRGSILEYLDQKGRRIKVVPTIHPAATFRSPYLEKRCRFDWARIVDEAKTRDLNLPQREHFIRPTLDDVRAFATDLRRTGSPVSIDIETPRESRVEVVKTKTGKEKTKRVLGDARITCIGFSYDPAFSITIPTTDSYWGHTADIHECWRLIRELINSPNEKILQNGLFDSFYLADHGIWLPSCNWRWDTLAMHHAIDANDDHDLAYMASVWTREPYWKDEAKDPDEVQKYTSNIDAFWTYNGKDAAVTRELYELFHAVLREDKKLDFYANHYTAMFDPLLSLMRHGVRRDADAANRRYGELTQELVSIQDRLSTLAGESLIASKSFSPLKLKRFLYETLRLPKKMKLRKGKDEPTVTIDEVALRQLMLKEGARLINLSSEMALKWNNDVSYEEQQEFQKVMTKPTVKDAIELILEHRRKEKLRDFLKEKVVDSDGRVRCSYRFTTETGRLSSSKNPRGTGMNLQNVDREVRDVFLPD